MPAAALARRYRAPRAAAVGVVTIVRDSFDRADAVTLGSAETGQTWLPATGFGIRSNKGYQTGSPPYAVVVEAGAANVSIQGTVDHGGVGGDWTHLVGRYTNDDNYLWFGFGPSFGIWRRQSGGNTLLVASGLSLAEGDRLTFDLNGSTLAGYVNGALACTVVSTFQQTATKVGWDTSSSSASIDLFQVDSL